MAHVRIDNVDKKRVWKKSAELVAQEKRVTDYVALHKRLDSVDNNDGDVSDQEFQAHYDMSRELDQLAIDIQEHDHNGRTVGEILGWDQSCW